MQIIVVSQNTPRNFIAVFFVTKKYFEYANMFVIKREIIDNQQVH